MSLMQGLAFISLCAALTAAMRQKGVFEMADELKTTYEETCKWYHAIDDFRAKLLGFLPFVSGTGIFFLSKDVVVGKDYLALAGLLGFLITLGLLFYELRGLQRCIRLRNVAKDLEEQMAVFGPFRLWPTSLYGLVNEPMAACIIYPAVLAAWIYFAIHNWQDRYSICIATSIFVLGFIGVFSFFNRYRKDLDYPEDKLKANEQPSSPTS